MATTRACILEEQDSTIPVLCRVHVLKGCEEASLDNIWSVLVYVSGNTYLIQTWL
jgi:hypothetical protein